MGGGHRDKAGSSWFVEGRVEHAVDFAVTPSAGSSLAAVPAATAWRTRLKGLVRGGAADEVRVRFAAHLVKLVQVAASHRCRAVHISVRHLVSA